MCHTYIETGEIGCTTFEYPGPIPCAGELQRCIDAAYWDLLAGLHDIDVGREDLTHEQVIKTAMKTLGQFQLGVG